MRDLVFTRYCNEEAKLSRAEGKQSRAMRDLVFTRYCNEEAKLSRAEGKQSRAVRDLVFTRYCNEEAELSSYWKESETKLSNLKKKKGVFRS